MAVLPPTVLNVLCEVTFRINGQPSKIRNHGACELGAADGALRALLEMLSDSDAHLDYVDKQAITDSLIPFAIILDEAIFI
jgi:hypothetical protein